MGNLIDYEKIPESDSVRNYIKDRYNKGLYTLLLAIGLPGTGKSSACQRLGELICEDLGNGQKLKSKDIVDSLEKFLERIINVKGPGEVIIIEEVSVLFPSKRAVSAENVIMGKVLDTCRKKQVILLSNAPVLSSIDSHIRQMAHILIETLRINKKEGVCVYGAWRLQTNPKSGKTYTHRFMRNNFDVDRHYVRQPSPEIWEEYEKDKDKFIADLYKLEVLRAIRKKEEEMKKLGIVKIVVKDKITELEKQVSTLDHQGLSGKEIAEKLKKSPQSVSNALSRYKKKAYLEEDSQYKHVKITASPYNSILETSDENPIR